MVKKIFSFSLCLFLAFCLALPVFAAFEGSRVFDDAGLLTEEEAAALDARITSVKASENLPFDIVILIAQNTAGKEMEAFADDFYDYHENGFGVGSDNSGVMLVIDMEERYVYICTTGAGIDYFTDSRIEDTLDYIYRDLQNGSYYSALNTFITQCIYYADEGVPNGQYQYDNSTGEIVDRYRSITPEELGFSAVVSVAVGLLAVGFVFAKYKAKTPKSSYPLREKAYLTLTRKEDMFLGAHTTQQYIPPPQNNSSSSFGGSGVHTGSSGRSHGGGGRHF